MFDETKYLTWANRHFGTVEHNLAKGGVRSVPLERIGLPARMDDPGAWGALRRCIARYNGVSVDEVLPALGTTHALSLAFGALVGPGDEVLVEVPGYEPLWRIPEGMGARIVRFERRAEEGFAASADRVAARLTPRTRVVVLTNAHNPSGARTSTLALAEIAAVCDAVGASLLVDEVYAPYATVLGADGAWGDTARHVAPNVMTVSGLSKSYGLGALRVGWLVGDPAIIRAAEHALQTTLGDPPVAHACLAVHAFSFLSELSAEPDRQLVRTLRDEVAGFIAAQPRLWWHAPEHGPFGLVHVEHDGDVTAMIERGAAEHGVLVAPGAFFGTPAAFRLGWSVAPGALTEALARLARVLKG